MRLAPEGLAAQLRRGLQSTYLVTGSEPLLVGEACDAVRAAAREAGHGDREVHFVERGFDWNALLADAANLSLFATRRLIELRFSSAPDAAASSVLASLAAQPPADSLLLVTGLLERKSLGNAWVQAFERHGVVVVAQPVARAALPRWIADRLESRGVRIEQDAAALLADRVEGNLLAAQQEIERIALLAPGATLDVAAVAEAVADSARYDVYDLVADALKGDAARALRVLAGLRAEGHEPPLLVWVLVQELRLLSRVEESAARLGSVDAALRAEQSWGNRQDAVRAALKRLRRRDIDRCLAEAALLDRTAKGAARGDPWLLFESLVARIAGVPLAA